MTNPAHRVEVHRDPETLATSVAGELLSRIAQIQGTGRDPHIALTGGTIARAIHTEVARLSPGSGVDWSRVVIWWGDERFVEAGSHDRNETQAGADLLDVVGATQVHPMPDTVSSVDVDAGAAAYSDELRSRGDEPFDIVMLGVGPDGHVASLFPDYLALEVSDRIAVGVTDSPKPPPERISLTFPTLNRATAVWFLVSGEEKAEAVEAALALEGEVIDTPARGVEGLSETTWFLDKPAASLL
ncbi:6-phosphogluconolactonase [Nocardioides salsibiostraticola]